MIQFPFLSLQQYLNILRIALGLMMAAHGVIRIYAGTVGGFGNFLGSKGIPLGVIVAWGITVFEISGGLTLTTGLYKKLICFIFIVELTVGIFFVHIPRGWFVVGYTVGGMEYSVLLILCFFTVASVKK